LCEAMARDQDGIAGLTGQLEPWSGICGSGRAPA